MLIKTSGSTGEFGEITISDSAGRSISFPTYTCGHCTAVVAMRHDRQRPRRTCLYCGRMVCDKEICDPSLPGGGCTPLYGLAENRFEGSGPVIVRAQAIMQGASTLAEIKGAY